MRRKTDFKQMFLIDSTLYKRVNSAQHTPSVPIPVPEIPISLPETPPSAEIKDTPAAGNSTIQKVDISRQATQPKTEKFFDASNPIVKALKKDHEHGDEPFEPPTKKARYEKNENEIDFKEMIREIDEEIKNWNELRKDAVKMQANVGRKRKQPRYIHYFADHDGTVKGGK